jgi:hypothetical protein
MSSSRVLTASVLALTIAGLAPSRTQAQGYETFRQQTGRALTGQQSTDGIGDRKTAETKFVFSSRGDSLNWAKNKKLADNSKGFRIIVSLQQARLWVLIDQDTLLSAPASVASGKKLSYRGYEKVFDMPRGTREVLAKDADPVWTPPDWLYFETAEELGLDVKSMPKRGLTMPDGRKLYVNERNEVGVLTAAGDSTDFPKDLHIIFDNTLYIPPIGTENRKVNGTLGKYKLVLGNGFLFHGTPFKNSIGLPATHGCVRLRDEDIEWMYENVPIGTKVYVY